MTSSVSTVRTYVAKVWPARPGRWDSQPVVASCQAGSMEKAIDLFLADQRIHDALVEEEPRLGQGWHVGEDHWTEDWPERAYVFVYPDHQTPREIDIGCDTCPILAVFTETYLSDR